MSINLEIIPVLSIIAGIVILISPKILNYVIAAYLIVTGVLGMGLLN